MKSIFLAQVMIFLKIEICLLLHYAQNLKIAKPN